MTFHAGQFSMLICYLLIFIKKFRDINRVSNHLNPEQAIHFVSLIWVPTIINGYKQASDKIANSREKEMKIYA